MRIFVPGRDYVLSLVDDPVGAALTMRSWFQFTLSVLVAATTASCCGGWLASYDLEASDLVGTWSADYEVSFGRRCWYRMTGVETLTLRADGTYQQLYDDGRGYVYVSPWNRWRLEEEEDRGASILHLEGGRFYPLGKEWAEALAERSWQYHSDDDGRGQPLDLDGTEVILHVRSRSGQRCLEYPPVCDLDAPVIVNFRLVASPA
ncbi:MAG: hypothetical protein GTO49_04500, partial [Anaerolineae bacterium]|nr:hypothetical protein [Anaerolineae bacterium]